LIIFVQLRLRGTAILGLGTYSAAQDASGRMLAQVFELIGGPGRSWRHNRSGDAAVIGCINTEVSLSVYALIRGNDGFDHDQFFEMHKHKRLYPLVAHMIMAAREYSVLS